MSDKEKTEEVVAPPEEKEKPHEETIQIEPKSNASDKQVSEVTHGDYLTVPQLAKELRYSYAYTWELIKKGRIKAVKPFGGQWRIPKTEVAILKQSGLPPLKREVKLEQKAKVITVSEELSDKINPPIPDKKPEGKKESWFPIDFDGLFKW